MKNMSKLSLYYYDSCPYCRQVIHELAYLGVEVDKRNILRERSHYEALVKGGGSQMVPCLLIEVDDAPAQWLYESRDIMTFAQQLAA